MPGEPRGTRRCSRHSGTVPSTYDMLSHPTYREGRFHTIEGSIPGQRPTEGPLA